MANPRTFSAEHRRRLGEAHRGSRNGPAKLDESQVPLIHRALERGESTWDLAQRYGVSHTAIWMIEVGRSWAWLTGRRNIGTTGRPTGRRGAHHG